MELKKGDRIRFLPKPEWGLGEVLVDSFGGDIEAFFVNAGKKRLLATANIEKVRGDEAKHPVLDNLYLDKSGNVTTRFLDFEFLVRNFLKQFPEGFESSKYLDEERNYKVAASEAMLEELGDAGRSRLDGPGRAGEICRRAMKALSRTNLVFPNEVMNLKDGLAQSLNQEVFAAALDRLLNPGEEIVPRLETFIDALNRCNGAKWTILTYFLFMAFPERYLFMKPTASQQAAEVFGFDIRYRSELNVETFLAHQSFADYLAQELLKQGPPLQPRDMIDVQSFVYRVSDLSAKNKWHSA